MGYFDAIASSAFKQDADGRYLFFPWGTLGGGYLIPSEQEYQSLRNAIVKLYAFMLPAIVALVVLTPLWVPCTLLVPFFVGYVLWVRRITNGWSRSSERLSLEESIRNQALRHQPWVLWSLFIGSSVFVLSGVLIVVSEPDQWLLGGGCIAFFGVCGFFGWRMLSARRRAMRASG